MGLFMSREEKKVREEIKELKKFIRKWSRDLSEAYKKVWDVWVQKRDQVFEEMNLEEIEELYITARELASYVGYDYARREGITKENADVKSKQKGNTYAFDIMGKMGEYINVYNDKCAHVLPEFQKRISRIR